MFVRTLFLCTSRSRGPPQPPGGCTGQQWQGRGVLLRGLVGYLTSPGLHSSPSLSLNTCKPRPEGGHSGLEV